MSHEDAAEGDATAGAVPLDAADQLALLADPDLAVPATELPPSVPALP
jgi:hypothetical protein